MSLKGDTDKYIYVKHAIFLIIKTICFTLLAVATFRVNLLSDWDCKYEHFDILGFVSEKYYFMHSSLSYLLLRQSLDSPLFLLPGLSPSFAGSRHLFTLCAHVPLEKKKTKHDLKHRGQSSNQIPKKYPLIPWGTNM